MEAIEIKFWEGGNKAWHELGKIKMIERRTKEDVIGLLMNHELGIYRRRRFRDYEAAKKICFEGLFIDSKIYDNQIGWICEYLRI